MSVAMSKLLDKFLRLERKMREDDELVSVHLSCNFTGDGGIENPFQVQITMDDGIIRTDFFGSGNNLGCALSNCLIQLPGLEPKPKGRKPKAVGLRITPNTGRSTEPRENPRPGPDRPALRILRPFKFIERGHKL